MGGGGFPTAEKLRSGLHNGVRHVIANGVECEPGIDSDLQLLKHHATDVLEGLHISGHCLGDPDLHLVVSDPTLYQALQAKTEHEVHLEVVPNKPANGEERRLIELVCNEHIPEEQYPTQRGYVVLNVATLFAICEAVRDGRPPSDRLVSVFGDVKWVGIGTSLRSLTEGYRPLLLGSKAIGAPAKLNATLTAEINAVEFDDSSRSHACIHCGWCNSVCPKDLQVEAMHRFANQLDAPKALQQHYDACFECGACVEACPSQIALLQSIRTGKTTSRQTLAKETALNRYSLRESRIEQRHNRDAEARTTRIQTKRTW